VILTRHRGAYIRAAYPPREADEDAPSCSKRADRQMERLAAETVKRRRTTRSRIPQGVTSGSVSTKKTDRPRSNEANIEKRRHFYDNWSEIGGNEQLGRINADDCRSSGGCRSSHI